MIWQRIGGLALILAATALSSVLYGSYWFSPEATTFGKAINIAIVIMFIICGVFFLVKKDSKTSLWRHLQRKTV